LQASAEGYVELAERDRNGDGLFDVKAEEVGVGEHDVTARAHAVVDILEQG
jgi:hypothetical protein